jgi:SAM-dependent methyltransferase
MTESDNEIKQQVRQFYDQIGWQKVQDGLYQNAHYEDLRPVSAEYIHRCHLRVGRYLKASGKYLLDAGSGPVQYAEYMDYLNGYQYRVCADISIVALIEARKKLGDKGLYVVADIANLPFKPEAFEGVMSMHTIHHLPREEHRKAYQELYRTLDSGCTAVVVNGWQDPPLTGWIDSLSKHISRLRKSLSRKKNKKKMAAEEYGPEGAVTAKTQKGTYVQKYNAAWLEEQLEGEIPCEILVWRSASVRSLRTLIHTWSGGKYFLRWLYGMEERHPHFFGVNGQYPLIVIRKPENK